MHIVDYFVIAGYFALVMYLGYYSMKKVSNFDDYAVAGRSMPLPIFFAAIAATLCGGGATIGRISFMHTTGIIVFFALTGVVINQIFSGLFISGRVHNAGKNVYSLGDLYGIYYGRSGRLLSSVFGFLFCVVAFGVQILAMGAILQTATGISLIPAALIASIVTLAYTWSGGILAVTLTDAVQYVIIVIGVTLCAYLAIDHLGGFDAMMSILYSNPRFETNMKPLANWSLVQFLGLFFSFLLGEFCAPYYIQRYASTKSAKDSKNGLLIFGVHWIFFMATTAAIACVHGDPARREARPGLHQPYPRHPASRHHRARVRSAARRRHVHRRGHDQHVRGHLHPRHLQQVHQHGRYAGPAPAPVPPVHAGRGRHLHRRGHHLPGRVRG